MSFRPESENYRYWTIQEDEKLTELVALATPLQEIAKILNRSHSSCASHSSILGLKNDFTGPKIYSVNENFWDEPNPLNCYYAGILAADGCLQLKNKLRPFVGTLSWEIGQDDIVLLEEFIKNTNYSGFISTCKNINRKGEPARDTKKIVVSCQRWNQNLIEKFNIVPKKTYRISPPNNLTEQQMFCWLIGYIDGDGTVFYNKLNHCLMIKISSSSEKLVNFVYEFLKEKLPQKVRNKEFSKPRKLSHANCYEISVLGVRATCLYKYAQQYNLPKLSRKWDQESINNLVKENEKRFPHLFDLSYLPDPVK